MIARLLLVFRVLRFGLPKPVENKPLLVSAPVSSATVASFRQNEKTVEAFEKITRLDIFKHALSAVKNSSPAHFTMPTIGTNPNDRVAQQCRTEGYMLCLSNLEALTTVKKTAEMPEASFEKPPEK